jgi:hypothetical protein
MKRTILFIFIASILSCGKEQNCEEIFYSEFFTAQENIDYCFEDGNSFTITKVNDNLCPCTTLCTHPGYVSINVELIIDGETYTGEMSVDPNLNIVINEPVLPDEYKIGIMEQEPASYSICGGEINPEDFKFTLTIKKK